MDLLESLKQSSSAFQWQSSAVTKIFCRPMVLWPAVSTFPIVVPITRLSFSKYIRFWLTEGKWNVRFESVCQGGAGWTPPPLANPLHYQLSLGVLFSVLLANPPVPQMGPTLIPQWYLIKINFTWNIIMETMSSSQPLYFDQNGRNICSFLMNWKDFYSPGFKRCNFRHNDIKIARQDYWGQWWG